MTQMNYEKVDEDKKKHWMLVNQENCKKKIDQKYDSTKTPLDCGYEKANYKHFDITDSITYVHVTLLN